MISVTGLSSVNVTCDRTQRIKIRAGKQFELKKQLPPAAHKMPTRTAASAATEVMEEEDEEEQQELPGLQFNEPLSWRAGRTIAVAELLRRLQTLWKEMRDMEQEENERNSFTHVAKELASHGLLAHKDKGVRAWTAACLVEILRLCAPDAPYTGQQLKVGCCS